MKTIRRIDGVEQLSSFSEDSLQPSTQDTPVMQIVGRSILRDQETSPQTPPGTPLTEQTSPQESEDSPILPLLDPLSADRALRRNVRLPSLILPPSPGLPPQRYPAFPTTLPPTLYQKITMMYEHLWLRPSKAAQSRVIAVDGFDTQAVQVIEQYLHETIRSNTNFTVRVFGPLHCPAIPNPDWHCYTYYINQWASLWQYLMATPFPPGTADNAPFCVNIIPFSPLMISLRAERAYHPVDEVRQLQAWRLLVTDWWSQIRPDITINVQDTNCMPHEPGVARFADREMNVLAVAQVPWEQDAIHGVRPKQLRRIGFEVLEWLMEE